MDLQALFIGNAMARREIDTIEEPIWRQLAHNVRDNVIYYRDKKGWSQEELSRKANLSSSAVADIEQGRSANPGIELISALTSALELADCASLLKTRNKK